MILQLSVLYEKVSYIILSLSQTSYITHFRYLDGRYCLKAAERLIIHRNFRRCRGSIGLLKHLIVCAALLLKVAARDARNLISILSTFYRNSVIIKLKVEEKVFKDHLSVL